MLRLPEIQRKAHSKEIISYGFAPGPPTKKELEPELVPVVQPSQQDCREAIKFPYIALSLAVTGILERG